MNRGNSHHGCLVKELDGSMGLILLSFIWKHGVLVNYLFLLELVVYIQFFFF